MKLILLLIFVLVIVVTIAAAAAAADHHHYQIYNNDLRSADIAMSMASQDIRDLMRIPMRKEVGKSYHQTSRYWKAKTKYGRKKTRAILKKSLVNKKNKRTPPRLSSILPPRKRQTAAHRLPRFTIKYNYRHHA